MGMWRKKKFILVAVLAAVILAAGIGGVALAADNNDESQATTPFDNLWEKMAAVLQDDGVNVTSDQLQSAFSEAQDQMRADAQQDFLDKMVADGKITQEQADAYSDWIKNKPDMGGNFGPRGGRFFGGGGQRFEFKMRGPGGFHGFGGFCPPAEDSETATSTATN
jgi:opacity protein-like surface antigen